MKKKVNFLSFRHFRHPSSLTPRNVLVTLPSTSLWSCLKLLLALRSLVLSLDLGLLQSCWVSLFLHLSSEPFMLHSDICSLLQPCKIFLSFSLCLAALSSSLSVTCFRCETYHVIRDKSVLWQMWCSVANICLIIEDLSTLVDLSLCLLGTLQLKYIQLQSVK